MSITALSKSDDAGDARHDGNSQRAELTDDMIAAVLDAALREAGLDDVAGSSVAAESTGKFVKKKL